jgi:hypothetical protein
MAASVAVDIRVGRALFPRWLVIEVGCVAAAGVVIVAVIGAATDVEEAD